MRSTLKILTLVLLAIAAQSCSCQNTPVPTPSDRTTAHQIRCHCGFDFDWFAEIAGARDQQFDVDLCLPNRLNVTLATGDDAIALAAMSDAEYNDAIAAYCSQDLRDMVIAVAGRANPALCDNLSHVATTCTRATTAPGQSAVFNQMCEVECADVPCRAPACDPSRILDSNRALHPEACKCTEALGCGIHTAVICTTPNWMTDPPTIASGVTTYLLSAPHAAIVDSSNSSATIAVSVDTGVACGVLTNSATTPVYGTITLFGPACAPGEACDRLMDFTLGVGDFSLTYTCGAVTQTANITQASLVGGSEGRVVHIDANGTVIVPTNALRLDGSFFKDGTERHVLDTHNTEPIMMHVDYATGAITLNDGISFVDGSLSLNISAQMANRPPVANAGADRTVECQNHGGVVTLDASASSDPDSNIWRYQWWAHGRALDEAAIIASEVSPTVTLPMGTTTIDLGVTDSAVLTAIDSIELTVVDTTAPQLVLSSLTPNRLWPPNHKLVTITACVLVDDTCDAASTFRLKSITSNEPDNGTGDGDTANDIQGADFGTADLEFSVRAERSGNGSGRIYTVVYEAIDASGNVTEVEGRIEVPHNR